MGPGSPRGNHVPLHAHAARIMAVMMYHGCHLRSACLLSACHLLNAHAQLPPCSVPALPCIGQASTPREGPLQVCLEAPRDSRRPVPVRGPNSTPDPSLFGGPASLAPSLFLQPPLLLT